MPAGQLLRLKMATQLPVKGLKMSKNLDRTVGCGSVEGLGCDDVRDVGCPFFFSLVGNRALWMLKGLF